MFYNYFVFYVERLCILRFFPLGDFSMYQILEDNAFEDFNIYLIYYFKRHSSRATELPQSGLTHAAI